MDAIQGLAQNQVRQSTVSELLNARAAEHRAIADQLDALALALPEVMSKDARDALWRLLLNSLIGG
jgi:Holliday junction resolvasome RuvABC endonuclease subunit